MKQRLKPCVVQHLVDKAKPGNTIPPGDWLDVAEQHLASAAVIINGDPAGALLLTWASMHKVGKALAAQAGFRLDDETHGKVVDFLVCVFDDLDQRQRGLVRSASTGRNVLMYDNPKQVNARSVADAYNLARYLIAAGRAATDAGT